MKYPKRFSRGREKDNLLLYFTYIITLIQIFYFINKRKYKALLFFFIIGIVLHLFIKNIPAVLIIDIIVTNILMRSIREGMEAGDATPPTVTTPAVPDDKTKTVHKDDTKTKNKKGVADQATPVESFENHEKKMKSVNDTILMLSNVMDKFSGISAKLGFKTE
jgi:hypothetical protein